LSILNSSFEAGASYSSGGAIVIQSSNASIENSSFNYISASPSGGTVDMEYSTLTVISSSFSNSEATNGGCFNSRESTLKVTGSRFSNMVGGVMFLNQMDDVVIEGTSYTNSTSQVFGAVTCLNCARFAMSSSAFTMSSASFSNSSLGGALYLTDTSEYQKSNFTITESTFDNNSAKSGGAMTVSEVDVNITKCVFKDNYASYDGGAILFSCSIGVNCRFEVSNSSFSNNSAVSSGGAIYWNANEPKLANLSLLDNKAKHGNDAAAYASSLDIVPTQIVSRKLDESGFVLQGVASGQKLPTITVKLLDTLGQLMTTDSSSTADISSDLSNVTVSGESKVVANEGLFVFDNVIVSMEPGTSATLTYSTSSIGSSQNSKVMLRVEARQCIIGEEVVGNSCAVCESGTYSLDPSHSCADCPSEAYCYGNYSMVPRAGYWRSGVDSDKFYKCPNEDACLGSNEAEMSYKGTCEKSYRGNKCNACSQGYSRSKDNVCGKCPDKVLNAVRLSFIFIGALLLCVILVRSTIKSATEPGSLHSIYFKIFANYLQLIMLTAQLQLDWPQIVIDFFAVHQTAGNVAEQMFSLDCYLEDDSDENSYRKVYFQKLIFISLVPFFLCFLSISFWTVIVFAKGKTKNFARHVMATIVVLMFLAHPSLTKTMFGVFSCIEIDKGETWLQSNLDIRCWDETHRRYALTVAMPFLLIFSIGLPTIVLGYLIKEQAYIDEIKNRVCLGFLYNGYKHRHFYWEFVILYRKIIIICLTVFLNTVSVPVQALFILLCLVLSWQLQYLISPFNSNSLNSMELRSIFVAAVTIYCGMFYLTRDLDDPSKICLFVAMLVANAYFLSIWVARTFIAVFVFFGSKISCIRKYVLKIDLFEEDRTAIHRPISPNVRIYHEEKSSTLISNRIPKDTELPLDVNDDSLDSYKAYFIHFFNASITNSYRYMEDFTFRSEVFD
jgi:hypothetical protein